MDRLLVSSPVLNLSSDIHPLIRDMIDTKYVRFVFMAIAPPDIWRFPFYRLYDIYHLYLCMFARYSRQTDLSLSLSISLRISSIFVCFLYTGDIDVYGGILRLWVSTECLVGAYCKHS